MPTSRNSAPIVPESQSDGLDLPARPRIERVGRFSGKLYLVLLDNKDRPSTRAGRSLWALQRELEYRPGDGDEELIIIPRGFVTDLTSVPRIVWSFYPPDGPWAKAAVIHDFLYFTSGTGVWHTHRGITRAAPYSRIEADDILKQAMADRKIGKWEQLVIWTAVRLGGAGGWGR
jgi:hypothetical protein